ncbi:Ig-like domain-containing protein, partial [Mycolicibacterium sp. XJ1819]
MTPLPFNSGASKYVGRVGALAVALGVGVVAATNGLGLARAETGAESTDTAAATETEATDTDTNSDTVTAEPGTLTDDVSLDTSLEDDPPDDITEPPPDPDPEGDTEPDAELEDLTPADTDPDPDPPDTQPPPAVANPEVDVSNPSGKASSPPEPAEPLPNALADSSGGEVEQAELWSSTTLVDDTSADDEHAFTTLSTPFSSSGGFETFHHVAPRPLELVGVVIPRALVTAATAMVGVLLTPFLAPGPIQPAQPPLLWVVLAWVRREVQRTFFNYPPHIRSQDITLTLEPGQTSGPIAFDAHDGDGDPLTYRVAQRGRVGAPQHGTVTVDQATGTFTYTPDAGFTGSDQFTVAVSDQGARFHIHGLLSLLGWHRAHTDRAKVRITVLAPNGAPIANADNVSTPQDMTVSGDVLANDTDPDDDPLTAELISGPGNGTLTFDSDGSFSYTPDPGWSGVDTFTYQASDGQLTSGPAVVTIAVTAINHAPVAEDDSYTVAEDGTLTVPGAGGLLANDSDADGTALTVDLVDGPANGTLTLNQDGSFVYKPDEDFAGTDTFTYVASDGQLSSNEAVVTITVTAVNDSPLALDDSYEVDEDGELTVTGPGVLANDSDIEGDALTAVLVDGPANGELTLNEDGSFTYTPDADFYGTDSFTYLANDGELDGNTATVTITVIAVNDAPVAIDDNYEVDEDGTLTVTGPGVLGNDTDADDTDLLTAQLVTNPSHGTLTLNADGSFTYTPEPDYSGADSFTYRAYDGTDTSSLATVTIRVNAVNDEAPVAADDAYAVDEDGVLTVPVGGGVLANDSDFDDDDLTAVLVDGPANGTLVLNADGSFTYTPDADFYGTDSFTYMANDGTADGNTATVTITVNPVNDEAPVTIDDAYAVDEDGVLTVPVAGGVLANDTDFDNDDLTAVLVDGPANGTLTLNADGSFTYTP